MRRRRALLAFTLALAACRNEPAQRPPIDEQVQDVAPPPDASLSTEADPQGKAAAPTFSGVLPETFPKDVPTYVPGTLVDFGERWIAIQTPDPPSVVRQRLPSMLRGRGWSVEGDSFTKAGRTLRLRIEDARPGTKIVVEY